MMVKAILKDYRKVAAPVEVRVVDDAQNGQTLWGADEKNIVLMGRRDGFPSPRSIPWDRVESLAITLRDEA